MTIGDRTANLPPTQDEPRHEPPTSSFFNLTPFDSLWQQMERGIQIIFGIGLITLFGFLGEAWGAPNVPYEAIFRTIALFGLCFMCTIFITPMALYLYMALRLWTNLSVVRINQIRTGLFNILLLFLAILLYVQVRELVIAMVEAQGLEAWDD
ncbi:MAG: hypothetical protein V6Z81_05475 [Parvularculales bacterium]